MPLSKKMEELIATITSHRDRLLEAVSGLSEAQLAYKPAEGDWTINDILNHLSMTDAANGKLMARALRHAKGRELGPDPTPEASVLHCLDDVRSQTQAKAKAPERFVPREYVPAETSLASLKESRARILADVEQLAEFDLTQLKYAHPILPDLDMYQWILIAGAHERTHASQIKRIKEEAGFPKA
jgi:hypothetical protein